MVASPGPLDRVRIPCAAIWTARRPSLSALMASKLNLLKAGLAVLTRSEKAGNTPVHLQIEPTTVCNLKCAFCIREKNVFKPRSLTLERFQEIFHGLVPSVYLKK